MFTKAEIPRAVLSTVVTSTATFGPCVNFQDEVAAITAVLMTSTFFNSQLF